MENEDNQSGARDIQDLVERLEALEARLPETKIISTSFWARSWAILGHQLAVTGVIYAVLLVLMLIVAGIGALLR